MTDNAKLVPMEVTYVPAWLTWVGCTTSCLRALGCECDEADVGGLSGYAFHLGTRKGLCPSGPTAFDWGSLLWGIHHIGRSVLMYDGGQCHTGKFKNDITRAQCKEAFELAKREVDAGRPCVLWGTYLPEFGVVVGYEGDSYIVKSFKECMKEPQPPIKYDEIDAPGCVYLLAFPTQTKMPDCLKDKYALTNAVKMFKAKWPEYHYGSDGYDYWISEMKAKHAEGFGLSYNAACYAEGRGLAKTYIERAAKRNDFIREDLEKASELYSTAFEAMDQVAKMFPFPGKNGVLQEDTKLINQACKHLKVAKDSECKAIEILSQVVLKDWPCSK
jgi:hypothetical protein